MAFQIKSAIIFLMKTFPSLSYEIDLWQKGFVVIGIDEVGRGAFAGPLFVGGVVFKPTTVGKQITKLLSYGINDSKKVTPQRRKVLSEIIHKECLTSHISSISVAQINRVGIGKATFTAMRDVVKNLREKLSSEKTFVLVDGFYIKYLRNIGLKNQQGIVGGDGISLSIAAASIIAKVARDNHMENLSAKFPSYKWEENKGYGTLKHRIALKQNGATPLHRKDFIENFI